MQVTLGRWESETKGSPQYTHATFTSFVTFMPWSSLNVAKCISFVNPKNDIETTDTHVRIDRFRASAQQDEQYHAARVYNSLDCAIQPLGLCRVQLLGSCHTTPWIVPCNSLDCVETTPWIMPYNSFGLCRTKTVLIYLGRKTPWIVSYKSLDCVLQLHELYRTTPWIDCAVHQNVN